MTDKEKAKRYDALQVAIKFWHDRYCQLAKENMEEAEAFAIIDNSDVIVIQTYHKAKAAVYSAVSIDMKHWIGE